ncbi:CU044_5270 family protein [Micromonospora sp. WMMD812]|uniref:CU044_5270 family protein n=1 Tax=Micromonospora sp. WMMD812 TaxID=3015152 RepID=UPI00248BBAA2|nr:CU044_5270 family protein [Micromonospora sp. WMMD812]WBB65204.1 CU044_5270 family protein [Micromonospora sp. WMMD812]
MSRTRDVLDLLAEARPARLDPPPNRVEHTAPAVVGLVANASALDGRTTRDQRRPKRLRMAFLGTVGAAATAVTAVVVAVAGPGAAPRDAPGAVPDAASPATQAPMDSSRLLLVAADRSDNAPQAGRRYQTIQTESGFAVPVKTADGTYTMFNRSGGQYWLARSSADSSWVFVQLLGAVPAAPSDEAAWRRNGSPAVIKVSKPKPYDLQIAPGKIHGNTVDPAHLFALGDRNVSQAQLDALPSDPAALRSALLSRFDGGGSDMPTDRDQWLFTVAASVVIDLPVSNEVRAAAYRLLATLPGVRGLGAVHDMRGRRGQAIAFAPASHGTGLEVRLIIDPDTGQALAKEMRVVEPRDSWSWLAPGALYTYDLVLVSKNTNDDPPTADVEN